jgi:hypothetical protein
LYKSNFASNARRKSVSMLLKRKSATVLLRSRPVREKRSGLKKKRDCERNRSKKIRLISRNVKERT